jgi:hypothetical protein
MWLPTSAQAPLGETLGQAAVVDGMRIAPLPSLAHLTPPKAAALDTWQWEQYTLSWNLAAKLGFAFGSVGGGYQSRVLVAEFSRSKTIETDGSDHTPRARFGVAARLVVHVRQVRADLQLTLPVIAAESQINNLEARANMTIEGYIAPDAGKIFPPFGSFDVESYVKMLEALTAAKEIIGEDPAKIQPVPLWRSASRASEVDLTTGLAVAWALTRIVKGDNLIEAQDGFAERDNPAVRETVAEVYSQLCGEQPSGSSPAEEARKRAHEALGRYQLHVPFGRDILR